MKLSAFIAAAAVIGGSFLIPNSAEAFSMSSCINNSTKAISTKETGNTASWSKYKTQAQVVCHYAAQASGSDAERLQAGLAKAGYGGTVTAQAVIESDLAYGITKRGEGITSSEPVRNTKARPSNSQPSYRSTSRNTSRSTTTASSRCPAGTSYHKIKRGLLLARKTVAEGCFTPYEAAQLNMQADRNENQRRANVMRSINANDQTQCFGSATTYGNNTYGSATCF